jgi:hypothetical protein
MTYAAVRWAAKRKPTSVDGKPRKPTSADRELVSASTEVGE